MSPGLRNSNSTGPARGTRDVQLRRHLATVREVLATLGTLTHAGQRNLIVKVVAFMRDEGSDAFRRGSRDNQRAAAELLDHLAAEFRRRLPDAACFGPWAESLVALLGAEA
jgi:hypothetical protein